MNWINPSGPTTCTFGAKYTEYQWRQFDNTVPGYPNCPPTDGSDNNWNPTGFPPINANAWTKWTIVDPSTLTIPPAPPAAWSVKATGYNCYDASTYYYPATGSATKPHTWSYYKNVLGDWSVNPIPITHQEIWVETLMILREHLTIIISLSISRRWMISIQAIQIEMLLWIY